MATRSKKSIRPQTGKNNPKKSRSRRDLLRDAPFLVDEEVIESNLQATPKPLIKGFLGENKGMVLVWVAIGFLIAVTVSCLGIDLKWIGDAFIKIIPTVVTFFADLKSILGKRVWPWVG